MASPARLSQAGSPRSRRRIGSACERCHRRRSKCDAWQMGIPCTACRKSKLGESCRLISSKRTRGHDGRFVVPQQQPPPSPTNDVAEISSETLGKETAVARQAPSPRSVTEPNINDELVKLYGDGRHVLASDQDLAGLGVATLTPLSTTTEPGTRHVGESWYATYVLHHSGPNAAGLPQLVHRASRTSTGEASRSAGSKAPPADLPPPYLIERLLEDYFLRFHVFCPILDRVDFLNSVRDGTVSATLLRCVLYVASIHCNPDTIYRLGFPNRVDAGDDLFGRAFAAFDADEDSDRLTVLLCSYFLHYWFGKPSNHRDALWWLATAIRSAQCMGLHRNSNTGSLEDRRQRRRIWWCLYIRDRQVALSTGTPMIINDLDCDVSTLRVEDFPHDSLDTARYLILQAELNRTSSQMFFCHCSPSRLQLMQDYETYQNASESIQANLTDWCMKAQEWELWHQPHQLSYILRLCYLYYTINLQQRLQKACPVSHDNLPITAVVHEAADEISHVTEDALLQYSAEWFPMILVSALLSAISVFATDGSSATTNNNEERSRLSPSQLSLKLRPYLLALKQLEQVYVLAHWIRSLFMKLTSTSSRNIMLAQISGASTTQTNARHTMELGYGSIGNTVAGSSGMRSDRATHLPPNAVSHGDAVDVEELGGGGDFASSSAPYFPAFNGIVDLDSLWSKLWMNVDFEDANAPFRAGNGW